MACIYSIFLQNGRILHGTEFLHPTGRNVDAGTITTDDAGVANLEVPLQAAFALTTVPSRL